MAERAPDPDQRIDDRTSDPNEGLDLLRRRNHRNHQPNGRDDLPGVPDVRPAQRSVRTGEPGGTERVSQAGRRTAGETEEAAGRRGRAGAGDQAGETVSLNTRPYHKGS